MSLSNREYVELRSDEVQEILGTPPPWLVQWGTLIVFLGVAVLVAVAAVVQYADTVPAQVVISRTYPPVDVGVPNDGHIAAFLARDSQLVQEGQVLAVLQSSAEYNDVRRLDALLPYWQRCIPDSLQRIQLPEDMQLGEMQAAYDAFRRAVEAYRLNEGDGKASGVAVDQRIAQLERSIGAEQRAQQRLRDQLAAARERYRRQNSLYQSGNLPLSELERERLQLNELEAQYSALERGIQQREGELRLLRQRRSSAELRDNGWAVERLRQTLADLQAALDTWKVTYLIVAPISGRVALNGNLFVRRQYVRAGQQLLILLPTQGDSAIARLQLPIVNSGKVRPGQSVIIRLEGYPYAEFGTLYGVVHSKSIAPQDGFYTVAVSLPQGLRTSYGKTIPLEHRLVGTAEIITEQKSLLRRVYEQILVAF